jgi:anti-anti-sigma regulatory factor
LKVHARPQPAADHVELRWAGVVDRQVTVDLRRALFEALKVPGQTGVRLDVREVTSISDGGLAVLVSANHRARTVGRLLLLLDDEGVVSARLASAHLMGGLLVKDGPDRDRAVA